MGEHDTYHEHLAKSRDGRIYILGYERKEDGPTIVLTSDEITQETADDLELVDWVYNRVAMGIGAVDWARRQEWTFLDVATYPR